MATSVSSPGLQEATKKSTTAWRENLEELFHEAKDRFPDVVWEVEEEGKGKGEEVWGHKAIVYARAPPSFQSRYFSFRQHSSSPTGTLPTTSALSLDIAHSISRTPSPFPSYTSPGPSTTLVGAAAATLLRLSTSITPALFSNELEYLYTGQGFGEAFEFLFDTPQPDADAEELRIDKLRKDLVFMWRSRLYSDVRIALTGAFSTSHENTTAIFSSHRFILVSRSPYFHDALLAWPTPAADPADPATLTLPSPPFTPASLHFTLGFIYTGTLVFSHRSYDLTTAFQILRSALYLSLPSLHDEIQARIVQEMLHGLFHAFLPFPEYESLTAGAWGTGGCRCRQCARRIPRVLEFSIADDVKNPILERGARRALVGLFGEGWCTSEFAALHVRLREGIVRGLGKRTTPPNGFPLLFAAEHALGRLAAVIDAWAAEVKEMVLTARKTVDELVCNQSEACFSTREWNEIMERDGVAFEDAERVEWIMASVSRGVTERNAPAVYQTLVSSILLRPHPTEVHAPMLSPTSHIRVQVEQARMDLLKWIAKRWLNIRQEGGFDDLDGWALKEISDNIEVPVEDLIRPISHVNHHLKPPRPSTLHRAKETESTNDTISMHSSMRVSVLNRNLTTPINTATRGMTTTMGPRRASPSSTIVSSSASSYKSLPRTSTASSTPRKSQAPSRTEVQDEDREQPSPSPEGDDASTYSYGFSKDNSRPDSKLTPAHSSIGLPPAYSPTMRSASPTPQSSIAEPLHPRDDDSASEYTDPPQSDEGDIMYSDAADDTRSLHSVASVTRPASTTTTTSTGQSKKVLIRKVTPNSTAMRRAAAAGAAGAASIAPTLHPSTSNASIRSSTSSVRSHASVSTIRKSSAGSSSAASTGGRAGARPSTATGAGARGTSTLSMVSNASVSTTTTSDDGTGTFHTANSSTASVSGARPARTRRTSAGSTLSVRGGSGANLSVGAPRVRKTSTGSVTSNISGITNGGGGAAAPKRRPAVPPLDTGRVLGVGGVKPRLSTTSIRSNATASGKIGTAGSGPKRVVSSTGKGKEDVVVKQKEEKVPVQRVLLEEAAVEEEEGDGGSNANTDDVEMSPPPPPAPLKIKRGVSGPEHRKSGSTTSTASNATLKRRGSADTITTRASSRAASSNANTTSSDPAKRPSTNVSKELPQPPTLNLNLVPRGATLEIGIPCIISSKRKRFKAYARYIGEVEGEEGPWVGIEVPISDSWGSSSGYHSGLSLDRDDGERQWHDGTWGGVRYFEIRGSGNESEWEYGDDSRATRRQRLDWIGGSTSSSGPGGSTFGRGKGFLKREGEQLGIDGASKRFRSVSPAVSDASGLESRGLFVRPQQVLYVVDAVGSGL